MAAGSRSTSGRRPAGPGGARSLAGAGLVLLALAGSASPARALSAPTAGGLTTTVTSVAPPVTVPELPAPSLPGPPPVTLAPVTVPTLPVVGGSGPAPSGTGAGAGGSAPAGSPGGAAASPAAGPAQPCVACAPSGAGARAPVGAPAPAPAPTTASPAASLVRRSLRDVAGAGFPLALVLLGLVYLVVQGRIDRRDPKLAAAALRGQRWAVFGGEDPGGDAGEATADGLVPLEERLRSMQRARAGLAAIALLLSATLASGRPPLPRMFAVTVAYCLVVGCAGEVWRAMRRRSLALLGALFTLDGVFLAWLVIATGGVNSPLQYLVPLYVATVALVASYRTGVRVAIWNSLLAVGAYYGAQASVVPGARPPGPGGFSRLLVFVVVLWVTAVVTATFSAVNERELRRRRFRLEVLHRLALEVQAAPTVEAVAAALADAAVDGLGFRRVVVVGGRARRPVMLAGRGADSSDATGPTRDRWFRDSAAPATVLADRIDADANPWTARHLAGATGVAVVPLVVGGRRSGALVAEHGGRRIDRGLLATLEQAASHAALAIGNRWLLEQIEALASTDGLTGLANRRSFDAAIDREAARAARSGASLSLVMVDVDHFKRVNDEHGHAAGDEVLRAVASAVRKVVRPYDVVARYGGEEIAVLLAGCTLSRARRTAERLRVAVARADLPVRVTVSAGVATLSALEAPEDLLRRADAALYRSKRAGRNRVTVDDGSPRVVRLDRARAARRRTVTVATRRRRAGSLS